MTERVTPRLLPFAAIAACAGLGLAVPTIGASRGLLFVVVIAIFLLALWVAYRLDVRRSRDHLSLLTWVGLFYFVAFVVGGVFAWISPSQVGVPYFSRGDLLVAVSLALLSWILLALGYGADLFRPLAMALPRPPTIRSNVPPWVILTPLLALGWAARFLDFRSNRYFHVAAGPAVAANGSSWFVDALTSLPLVALGLAGCYAYERSARAHWPNGRKWFVALLLIEALWAIPTGARHRLVGIAIVVLVVRYYAGGVLPSRRVIAVGVTFVVLVVFPLLSLYRGVGNYQASPGTALRDALTHTFDRNLAATIQSGGTTLGRFSDVTALARIVDQGPGRLGLWPGESLSWAGQTLIPRAIYPGKTDPGTFGNRFGQAYGFTSPQDYSSSFAATQPGELLLNGGVIALLILTPLLGSLYRALNDYLGDRRDNFATTAIYAMSVPSFVVGLETIIAVGLIGVLKSILFYVLILVVLGWLYSAVSTRSSLAETPS